MKLSSCLLVCALAAPMLQAFPVPAARGEQLLAQGALAPRTPLSASEASQAADSLLTKPYKPETLRLCLIACPPHCKTQPPLKP
jgi:hypothetical protein